MVGWLDVLDRLDGWMVGRLDVLGKDGWMVGWLVGCLAGWLAVMGRLDGWLVGCTG